MEAMKSQAPQRIHKLGREATSSFATEPNTHHSRGQRTSQTVSSDDYRYWLRGSTSTKDETGDVDYPVSVRDSARSGLGCFGNRYLHYLVEFISVNVGDSYQHVKASSQPMVGKRVGGSIVVRARESLAQGEGSQEADTL